jgi:Ca2+-binding EF-hand superfamily protein/C-terminal processing protease CtpA/Prc
LFYPSRCGSIDYRAPLISPFFFFFLNKQDGSGVLDVFELSSAVGELWGQAPTPAQVSAMMHATGALAANTLSLLQFASIFEKDWASPVAADGDSNATPILTSGESAAPGDWYNVVFSGKSLGFGVSLDKTHSRIVIQRVGPAMENKVSVGDGILAVNGAPMGQVKHPAALQEKLKALRRPLTITFVRDSTFERNADSAAAADVAAAPAKAMSVMKALFPSIAPCSHSPAVIQDCFQKYDWNASGDLDIFELSSAVADLWGQAPTASQISAILRATTSQVSNSLSLQQFADIFETDWSTVAAQAEPIAGGENAKPGEIYVETFSEASLGFEVSHDIVNTRIVVSAISPAFAGKLQIGDGIVTVNSAPMGKVDNPSAFQRKLKELRRPVSIVFVRHSNELTEASVELTVKQDASEAFVPSMRPGAHSAALVGACFRRFDFDSSGDLDTFELASAVSELWGQPPTTAQVTAMVRATGALETNTLSLQQFTELLATDWSKIATEVEATAASNVQSANPSELYEVTFSEPSLGFGVSFDKVNSRIVVKEVGPVTVGKVHTGDGVLAVNGAPLGKVNHPAALQQRMIPLRRPVTLTFVRGQHQVEVSKTEASVATLPASVRASIKAGAHSSDVVAATFAKFDWYVFGLCIRVVR